MLLLIIGIRVRILAADSATVALKTTAFEQCRGLATTNQRLNRMAIAVGRM